MVQCNFNGSLKFKPSYGNNDYFIFSRKKLTIFLTLVVIVL